MINLKLFSVLEEIYDIINVENNHINFPIFVFDFESRFQKTTTTKNMN